MCYYKSSKWGKVKAMSEQFKRVAVINDISGIGKCSLTASIPIFSCLGVEVCPFITAVLSNQTAFSSYSFYDFTEHMRAYKEGWDKLNIKFDGIYSGFLGSEDQVELILDFIKEHKEALIVVDPVMGDDGVAYSTYTNEMCEKMKELVSVAHVITPNLTEACILTNRKYDLENMTEEILKTICLELRELGPSKIVITGISREEEITNFFYDGESNEFGKYTTAYNKKYFSGTGDIFSSIVCGMILKGYNLKDAIKMASDFIYKSVEFTSRKEIDGNYGVRFEPFLRDLIL